jgi:hypothetical protein
VTDTHKAQRATPSNQLFLELLLIKHHRWHFVITLDESRYYLTTEQEQISLQADQEPPERAKHTIQDTQVMVATAWTSLGFHLVRLLSKGKGFHAEYYRDNLLMELIRLRPVAGERSLVIHVDNGRPHLADNSRTVVPKMGYGPAHIRPTRPISHHQNSSSSVM